MSRPWNQGSQPPNLEPDILGQFNSHSEWVSHASSALTGTQEETKLTGWDGNSIAVCIDALGRRCLNGGDFARARDENAFPVRYFVNFKVKNDQEI